MINITVGKSSPSIAVTTNDIGSIFVKKEDPSLIEMESSDQTIHTDAGTTVTTFLNTENPPLSIYPGMRKGEEGLSAYDLAVNSGFIGTIEEWLMTLIGPMGGQGLAGDTGLPGQNGIDGRGIVSVDQYSNQGTSKTYRITFTDNTFFDFEVTDGEVTFAALNRKADLPTNNSESSHGQILISNGNGGSEFIDHTFVHEQTISSRNWTICHDLNKFPSVIILDSAGTQVVGEYEYVSSNQLVAHFSGEFSGKAYLN